MTKPEPEEQCRQHSPCGCERQHIHPIVEDNLPKHIGSTERECRGDARKKGGTALLGHSNAPAIQRASGLHAHGRSCSVGVENRPNFGLGDARSTAAVRGGAAIRRPSHWTLALGTSEKPAVHCKL